MPPKKKQDGPSKKNQEKAKEKVIEDKTFGLKNKKGKKQQQFIKTVTHQVKHGGNPSARKLEQMREEEKQKKKDSKQNKLDELSLLFKPVQAQQKVSAGADPKSVLCAFFKQGLCTKGNKCKFSHDLSLERKGEKRSVYADEQETEKDGGMEDWSQDQLEEVVKKKHEEAEKKKPKTNIICKYFLEAIDKSLYGWFWTCPNGEKCIYKHALPPGFVLKRKEAAKPIEDQVSLEELIEKERSNLGDNLTPVTLNTFLVWKKKKLKEKKENLEKEVSKKKEDFERGKSVGKVSGRELFLFKPELAEDDDDEAADDPNLYRREEEQDHEPVKEITIETLAAIAQQSDGTGTKAKCLSGKKAQESQNGLTEDGSEEKPVERPLADLNGSEEACAANVEFENKEQILLDGVPVEESLFEDDVDDLELDELDIND